MKPTRADIDALVSVLEDESHADAESMALAVWEAATELASHHSSWAVRLLYADGGSALGPIWDAFQAKKVAKSWEDVGFVASVHRLKPAHAWERENVPDAGEKCNECGHAKVGHVDRNWRPHHVAVSAPSIPPGCGHFVKKDRCPCKETFGFFKNVKGK